MSQIACRVYTWWHYGGLHWPWVWQTPAGWYMNIISLDVPKHESISLDLLSMCSSGYRWNHLYWPLAMCLGVAAVVETEQIAWAVVQNAWHLLVHQAKATLCDWYTWHFLTKFWWTNQLNVNNLDPSTLRCDQAPRRFQVWAWMSTFATFDLCSAGEWAWSRLLAKMG